MYTNIVKNVQSDDMSGRQHCVMWSVCDSSILHVILTITYM